MGLHHRKLTAEICTKFCHQSESCSSDCFASCFQKCSTNHPNYNYPYPPPSPSIFPDDDHPSKAHKLSTFLIITLTLLASAFLVLLCFAIYARFFSGWSRRRRSQQQTEETRDVFVDEEHGPVVDHPIWYIRTTGLQESLISEITVCKYKKGEGLIEGTECSVCLSEFQEDENLRLLPKCNHAFHLPCIDTWLRSHTNCPMCRAPIVSNQARMPALELVDSNSAESSGTQMEILENGGENNGEMENRDPEMGNENEAEEEAGQLEVEDGRRVCEARRISVSLDSSSAAKINHALSVESADGNSSNQLGDINEPVGSKRNENLGRGKGSRSFRTRSLESVAASTKRSSSYNGKHLLSWNGRSKRKQSIPLRSF